MCVCVCVCVCVRVRVCDEELDQPQPDDTCSWLSPPFSLSLSPPLSLPVRFITLSPRSEHGHTQSTISENLTQFTHLFIINSVLSTLKVTYVQHCMCCVGQV